MKTTKRGHQPVGRVGVSSFELGLNVGRQVSNPAFAPRKTGWQNTCLEIGLCTVFGGVIIACAVCLITFVWAMRGTSDSQAATWKPSVSQSVWDGSVSEVKQCIATRANDPSSLSYQNWNVVEAYGEKTKVDVDYRAKNGFGALVLSHATVYFDTNGKITYTDLGQD
ncbi:MAG TPA: hypothetical protein VG347_17700 [Verrucomicrobiae bacterium]|nr:hypothetical protein [Verrucomicrobiae bacterium]